MPHLIGIQQSIDASIELLSAQPSYRPGDIVSGIIKKVSIQQGPETVACGIRLVGRIDTRLSESNTDSNGKSSSTWHHGKKTLFDFGQPVYSGPVFPGINTWPFSLVIPHAQALPPMYYTTSESVQFARRDWLYVEYFLQAEVAKSPSRRDPAIAFFPLYIRHASTPGPLTSYRPQIHIFDQSVRTLHLDPAMADKHLSLRQHMQTVFKPSSIPVFAFSLAVEHPSVVQLAHARPISFRVHARPIQDQGQSRTSDPWGKSPPVLTLMRAELGLTTSTRATALEGTSSKVTGTTQGGWSCTLFDWRPAAPPTIPAGRDVSPTDVGALLQLRVSARGVSVSGQPLVLFERPLWPSFESHHVGVSHELEWRLEVGCAGKTRKIKGTAPVTLLGPSEAQEQTAAARVGSDGIARAYRQWSEGLEEGYAMAMGGGPAVWAAGELT